MTDSLRTRIAAAMFTADQGSYMPYYEGLADAVIAELGLRQVTDVNRSVPQSRYVTDWETDQ